MFRFVGTLGLIVLIIVVSSPTSFAQEAFVPQYTSMSPQEIREMENGILRAIERDYAQKVAKERRGRDRRVLFSLGVMDASIASNVGFKLARGEANGTLIGTQVAVNSFINYAVWGMRRDHPKCAILVAIAVTSVNLAVTARLMHK